METFENVYVELQHQHLSESDITRILHRVTGQVYTFASASAMRWGRDGEIKQMGAEFPDGFYQLMPLTVDDGFFDWYCANREDQQFFENRETAALHFIYFWRRYKEVLQNNKEMAEAEESTANSSASGSVSRTFEDACILQVDLSHNGFQGGDAGHGGYVSIDFINGGSVCMEVDGRDVNEVNITVRGDAERRVLVDALKFLVSELEK